MSKQLKTTTQPSLYQARGGAIVGRNLGRFFNRPLYSANTGAFVLAGDLPLARFASGCSIHGTFFAGLARGGRTRWFHEMDDVTVEYRGNHARWIIRDRSLRGMETVFDAATLGDEVGFAASVEVRNARRGDRLIWVYGGAVTWPGPQKNLNWELDPHCHPEAARLPFDPAFCAWNRVRVASGRFNVAPFAAPGNPTSGRCDTWARPRVASAGSLGIGKTQSGEGHVVRGLVDLRAHPRTVWSFSRDARRAGAEPAERLQAALARSAGLSLRFVVETPDERLNALASVLPAALDGAWYPPVFRHGAMLWNVPYPGWRTVCGGTAAGWHDRVRAEASYYIGSQVRTRENRSTRADPALLLTQPARDSRFYGRGRIKQDQGVYNMQSQFFDQLIHAWRWTGDPKLEVELRQALELHLEWIRDCFDPDGDGLYESFINCWPTDSVWYAGGGATEETSYAYRGHLTAREMALRAGDLLAARRHEAILGRIERAFRARLWIKSRGHAGLYREQGGLGRLHEDAWLYSIFLPIDAGLLSPEEAAASLHYTEWGLQNDRMPSGGRQVWTSNFTPGMWSVRVRWPGDNYHLALAYFKSGLARDGWDVFRGTFLNTGFNRLVPGDFGASEGGTDFGDCTHMFARTLVEGLFGYDPDYPAGVVRISPQFPEEWRQARLRTPDAGLSYRRERGVVNVAVEITRPARIELRVPIAARDVRAVTVDGLPVSWEGLPGIGLALVKIDLPEGRGGVVRIVTGKPERAFRPVQVEGEAGKTISLGAGPGSIVSFTDPQGAIEGATMHGGRIRGRLRREAGHATVEAIVRCGSLPQRRLIRVAIKESRRAHGEGRPAIPAGATWNFVDLRPVLNGDIRTIFKQRYLSPRPSTVSARIGTDGYSPWTFVYWNAGPPEITLGGVPSLLDGGRPDVLRTPQGVPFAWPGGARNVAFVSRWDNWPGRVSVKVGRSGGTAWFLIGGSTNPMQGRIANAVLTMRYADGTSEKLELVAPINYWNLCPVRVHTGLEGQENRDYYTAATDAFCIPSPPPETVELGANCRVMLLSHPLRPGAILERVSLEALSHEVVVGLLGLTVMQGRRK